MEERAKLQFCVVKMINKRKGCFVVLTFFRTNRYTLLQEQRATIRDSEFIRWAKNYDLLLSETVPLTRCCV